MSRVVRNVLFSLVGFGWPVVLLLVATPVIVRGLGEAAYGVWALAGNVTGYLSVYNSLQTAGTKYLAEYIAVDDRASIQQLLGTSLLFNLVIGALLGGLLSLLAEPLAIYVFKTPPELLASSIMAFRLTGLSFCISTVGWWGAAILAGAQRFDWLTGVSVTSMTTSILGSVLTVRAGFGVVGVVWANLGGGLLSAALSGWAVRRLLPGVGWSINYDPAMLRRLISYGSFSTLQAVFGIIATQLDRTLLGIWIGVGAVAVYSVPLSVAARIHQLCSKGLEVVFPVSSSLGAQRRSDQLERLFLRAQNLNSVLVIMLSVPLSILAREILTAWISPEFAAEATLVFQLLILAYALLACNVVLASLAAGLGHPEVNAAFGLGLGLANFVGYVLFIPRWGVDGAGIASVFGSVAAVPAYLWYVNHRFLGVSIKKIVGGAVVRPVLAGIVVALGLLLGRPMISGVLAVLLALVISCTAYLGLTIMLGVWQAEELVLVSRTWRRMVRREVS